MAFKTLKETISNINIGKKFKIAFVLGEMSGLVQRLDDATSETEHAIVMQLRDYMAHRVMLLGDNATAHELFEDIFRDIPAIGGKK